MPGSSARKGSSAVSNKSVQKKVVSRCKIPTCGSKAQVFNGTAKKTAGGVTKKGLVKVNGNILFRKKRKLNPKLKLWMKALKQAKKEAQIPKQGACAALFVNKKSPIYTRAKQLYKLSLKKYRK
jgi:hypothetical protein